MAKKIPQSPTEKKLRRQLHIFRAGFFLLVALFGFTIYANFDYWAFRFLIANNYTFYNDLDTLYAMHIRPENRQSFHRDFDRVMISVFTAALREINEDRYTYLYSPQALQATIERERVVAQRTAAERLSDTAVILYLPNFSGDSRRFVQQNRAYLAQYSQLVLDLRGNLGGWLSDAHWIGNMFLPDGTVMGREYTRMPFFTRIIRARGEAQLDFDSIFILQNARTASASEALIMSLQENLPNVKTIGQTTFGKGIGQITVPLTGGYAVRATVMDLRSPRGQSIHMRGIVPDLYVGAGEDFMEVVMGIVSK